MNREEKHRKLNWQSQIIDTSAKKRQTEIWWLKLTISSMHSQHFDHPHISRVGWRCTVHISRLESYLWGGLFDHVSPRLEPVKTRGCSEGPGSKSDCLRIQPWCHGVTIFTQWSGRHWKALFSLSLMSPVSSASLDSLSGDSESVPKSLTYQSCCGQRGNPNQCLQNKIKGANLLSRKERNQKILSQLLASGSSATQNLMQSTRGLLRSSVCSASSFKALGPLPAIGPHQLASIDGHLR